MRLPTLLACLAVSASVFIACRGGDDDNTPVDGNGSNGSGSFVKIQDVQNDAMAPNTPVALHNVVVTAIDTYGAKAGDIWVEEQGGGKRSGVHVYNAPLDQVAMLVVGDVIDLKGAIKTEFALTGSNNADLTGRTLTELEPASGGQITITKSGMNAPITPDKVDALAIGQKFDPTMLTQGGGQAFSDAWEDWEGVLVELDSVSATEKSTCIGSACSDPTAKVFGLTGVINAESTLAAFPDDMNIARGYCFSKMTGVVDYFYDYLILPRLADDVGGGGTSCPVAEASCTDGIDNDGNGFIDCADLNCAATAPSCSVAATVSSIQNGTVTTGTVKLTGTYVVAVSFNKHSMWISDNAQAAPYEGVQVFGGSSADYTTYAVGSKVDVIATIQEFNNDTTGTTLTELRPTSVTAATGTGTIAAVTNQTAATLAVEATAEMYEGVLVTLTNVAVMTLGNSGNHGAGSMKQAGTTFEYQSDILPAYLPAAELGKCYATVTGVWSYDVNNNVYSFEPLVAGTGTGTCN